LLADCASTTLGSGTSDGTGLSSGLAGQEAAIIGAMMASLNEADFELDLVFTTERPESAE
jgi:hypothetical protein